MRVRVLVRRVVCDVFARVWLDEHTFAVDASCVCEHMFVICFRGASSTACQIG